MKSRKVYEQKETPASWISLSVKESSKKLMSPSINVKIGNAVIEVESRFGAENLLSVIKVLRTLC